MPDSGSLSKGQWVTAGSESRCDAPRAELCRTGTPTGGFRVSGNTGPGSEYRAGSWFIPRRVTLCMAHLAPSRGGTRKERAARAEAKDALHESSALLRAGSVRRREKRESRALED